MARHQVRLRPREDHSCLQDGLRSLIQAVSASTTSVRLVLHSGILLLQDSVVHLRDRHRRLRVGMDSLSTLSRVATHNSSTVQRLVQQLSLRQATICDRDRIKMLHEPPTTFVRQ